MSRIELGVASRTMAGETSSADRHVIRVEGSGVLIAVVDGLGHGAPAVHAAMTAVQLLEQESLQPLAALVARLHEGLRATRGVVMSAAAVDLDADTLQWLGVGNVAGLLVREWAAKAERLRSLVQRGGVVGHSLPVLHAQSLPIAAGDTLVFATDGVDAAFDERLANHLPVQRLAQDILARHGRSDDDALVLVARVVGGGP